MSDEAENPITMEAILGSSHIDSAGYDPDSGVMIVQFQNGSQYQWNSIPAEDYENLRTAPSAGKYLRIIEAKWGKGERIG